MVQGPPSSAVTSTKEFAFGTPDQILPRATSCSRGRWLRLTSRGVSRLITGLSISGPSSYRYGLSLISLFVNWTHHIAEETAVGGISEDVVMHRLCRGPNQDGWYSLYLCDGFVVLWNGMLSRAVLWILTAYRFSCRQYVHRVLRWGSCWTALKNMNVFNNEG
jgi:hypothetical protein